MAYILSPSALSLMKDCERCFWLTQKGLWKRPASIFPSLPSGMDLILKKHYDSYASKGGLPPELKQFEELKEIKLFDDFELLNSWRNNREGIFYEDENGNILKGAIDNILVSKEGKLIVLDYKTRGFPLKEDTHKHYQNQLDLYNFILLKMGKEVENFSYLVFYHPKEFDSKGKVEFNVDLKKIEANPKSGEKLFNYALKLLEGNCLDEMCEWCKAFR